MTVLSPGVWTGENETVVPSALAVAVKNKGFTGVIGMEHGNAKPGKEGDTALIAAYRSVDPV